ncbi:fimbrial protein [Proteus terrae]|uniref:fimbrial protein n=1 Tax=Proteus terrae TaxID=1574161 RepID=UPI000D68E756|nr:fimbrial protein [Proteus terrae]
MKPTIKNSLALILLLFPVAEVMAKSDVTCTVDKPTQQLHITVSGSVFLGPDAPVGSVIYQSYVDTAQYYYSYNCSADRSNLDDVYRFVMTESTKMLSISGTPVVGAGLPSNVFQTNLPGVGIQFYTMKDKNRSLKIGESVDMSGEVVREFSKATIGDNVNSVDYWSKPYLSFVLIKTGPITPGNAQFTARNQTTIHMPNTRLDHVIAPDFPFTFFDVFITGNVNVMSSTCRTQDYTVNLGSHETTTLPAKGSTTKWINSDIILTNCPAFRGYYSGRKGNIISTEVKQTFPERDSNELRVTIKPVNPTIPEYPGTFKVNDVPGAAKGVGIQLAFGATGEDFVKFNTPTAFAQPITEKAGVVSVPLRARYIRVDDRLSAGSANGAATFMIEYY